MEVFRARRTDHRRVCHGEYGTLNPRLGSSALVAGE